MRVDKSRTVSNPIKCDRLYWLMCNLELGNHHTDTHNSDHRYLGCAECLGVACLALLQHG